MYPLRLLRASLLCAALWSFLCTPALAQGPAKACGDLPRAELSLQRLADIFVEDEFAWFRDPKGIVQLAPDAPRSVVTEARECRRVVRAVRAKLRDLFDPAPTLNDFEYAIFRYGPYYAVLLQSKPAEGVHIAGYTPLLIFRAATLEYLGSILV